MDPFRFVTAATRSGGCRRERRVGRTWHLEEAILAVRGELVYRWRAVDEHGHYLYGTPKRPSAA